MRPGPLGAGDAAHRRPFALQGACLSQLRRRGSGRRLDPPAGASGGCQASPRWGGPSPSPILLYLTVAIGFTMLVGGKSPQAFALGSSWSSAWPIWWRRAWPMPRLGPDPAYRPRLDRCRLAYFSFHLASKRCGVASCRIPGGRATGMGADRDRAALVRAGGDLRRPVPALGASPGGHGPARPSRQRLYLNAVLDRLIGGFRAAKTN